MTDDRIYLAALERALKRRGLDEFRTAEVIREMANHVAESGDRPLEAFGEPEQYAAALLGADQPEGEADRRYEARTFRATAADEMAILAELGRDGWELTGVRDFGLHARRPRGSQPPEDVALRAPLGDPPRAAARRDASRGVDSVRSLADLSLLQAPGCGHAPAPQSVRRSRRRAGQAVGGLSGARRARP